MGLDLTCEWCGYEWEGEIGECPFCGKEPSRYGDLYLNEQIIRIEKENIPYEKWNVGRLGEQIAKRIKKRKEIEQNALARFKEDKKTQECFDNYQKLGGKDSAEEFAKYIYLRSVCYPVKESMLYFKVLEDARHETCEAARNAVREDL